MTLPNCLRCGQPRNPAQLGPNGWCDTCRTPKLITKAAPLTPVTRAQKPQCMVTGCTRTIKCRRMCDMHYRRWLDHPLWPLDREPANRQRCTGPRCDRFARALGLCGSHYMQQQRGAELTPLRPAQGGRRRGFKTADLAAEVEMLIGTASAENIAARLRYADADSLITTLTRAGHADLSRRLRETREQKVA